MCCSCISQPIARSYQLYIDFISVAIYIHTTFLLIRAAIFHESIASSTYVRICTWCFASPIFACQSQGCHIAAPQIGADRERDRESVRCAVVISCTYICRVVFICVQSSTTVSQCLVHAKREWEKRGGRRETLSYGTVVYLLVSVCMMLGQQYVVLYENTNSVSGIFVATSSFLNYKTTTTNKRMQYHRAPAGISCQLILVTT